MNKNIIQIGSLCIFILLMIGLLYFMKTNEGFLSPPAPSVSLTNAKQAVSDTNAAISAAKIAVGSSTEISTAKEAFTKATAAVSAANSAVSDTKAALGNLNISELEKMATMTKTNFENAQKVVNDKNAAGSEYKRAEADVDLNNPNSAVAKAVAAKTRYNSLPD